MVASMIEGGPYVRFVWTIAAVIISTIIRPLGGGRSGRRPPGAGSASSGR